MNLSACLPPLKTLALGLLLLATGASAYAEVATLSPSHALTFDGMDDYVETSAAVIPASGVFTVELWAECPTAPSSAREIISQGSLGNAFYIGTDSYNNIRLGDAWGTVAVPMPIGGWHHFALVRTETNTFFYLDGVLKATKGSAIPNPAATTGLRFGRQYGQHLENWPGSIGDVRVWSCVRSPEELALPLGGTEAGLLAWWRFNEEQGTTCTALGSLGTVGTLHNGPFWAPQAKLTQSPPSTGLIFDGVNDYVETSTAVIPTSGDFTVEFWAECPTAPNSAREIISQGSLGNAFYIGTEAGNYLRLGDGWLAPSPGVRMPIGGWHHFALVRTSTNAFFYLDGVLKAVKGSAIPNPAATTGLRFGRQYAQHLENWPGRIGDVRIWSRALGRAELAMPLAGNEANLSSHWRFNELASTTCTATGSNPVVGTLLNGPQWWADSSVITVTNVTAAQRPGTKLVDIRYDVTGPVMVSLEVKNGAMPIAATSLSGDSGSWVQTGTGKTIVWNAGADWGGNVASGLSFTVSAKTSDSLPAGSAATTANLDTRDYTLTVASPQGGNPVPAVGTHTNYCWRSTVTPTVDATVAGYISAGWTGTGSIPATGSANTTGPIVLNEVASSIAWKWTPTYSYTTSGGTITLTKYTGPGGVVTIPATIDNLPVTNIGEGAFAGCTGLTAVTIPNSITSIGLGSFYGCTGLTAVTIPNSVTSIGEGAFWNCTSLTAATIPNGVTSIKVSTFLNCWSLASVSIPNSVTSIGPTAFNGCKALTAVTIPDSVTSIGNAAFANCLSLTAVTIPNRLTSIGEGTFQSCKNLTVVAIPNSVTSIGERAFNGCTGLTEVIIPNSVTSIGLAAFMHCSGLTEVTIPSSVTSIGMNAFANCSGLMAVTIPNSVTSIGESAFESCSGLVAVTIPNSITTIGDSTFAYCENLIGVSIPNSVTSIGDYAFYGCTRLISASFQGNAPTLGSHPTMAGSVFFRASARFVVYYTPSSTGFTSPTWYDYPAVKLVLGDAPTVATIAASGITATGAILHGTVNPNGFPTTAKFEYGLTTAYGSTTSATSTPLYGMDGQTVSASLSGLQAGQTYHYRLTATSREGTSTGADMTLVTLQPLADFARWLADHGLTGDAAELFAQDRNSDGVPNGFEYAFGANLPSGTPLLTLRRVNGRLVVETPRPDAATLSCVTLRVVGSTDLKNWTLPVVPATDTTGKPTDRDWSEPQGTVPAKAFFRLEVELN